MKKRTIAILLSGTMAVSLFLGGCGKKNTEDTKTGQAVSIVEEESVTEEQPDYLAPGVDFPEDAEDMIPVMQALMASADGNTDAEYYNEGDSELDREYFWNSIRYLVSVENRAAEDTDGEIKVDKADVAGYARALFGNYDVEEEGLPNIPDLCRDTVTYQGYNGIYTFELLNTDDVQPYITICDEGDTSGSYKFQADLKDVQDDETIASFGFMMEKNDGSGTSDTSGEDGSSDESSYTYKITSCVGLDADDADEEEADVEEPEETDPDETDAEASGTDQNESETDTPDETNVNPSEGSSDNNSNGGDNGSSSNGSGSGISKNTAQSAAQEYMDERVSDDGSTYSMSYSGTKDFDGVSYYSYSVTKKDAEGNSSYVTNIYVDAATGSDVWDEAN